MAFLRIDRKKSGQYICIAETYRTAEGKVRTRVLHNLGSVADYTPEQLQRIGSRLYELGGGELKDLLGPDAKEIARYNYGYVQVYGKAAKHYGIDVMINRLGLKHKLTFNLYNAVLLMLLERLQDPCSKRANWFNQSEYLGIKPLGLHHLYRALDKLADNSKLLQRQIFETGRDLFNRELDVVFYDVTTLYFESEKEQEGKLRQMGFGKDGKIGNTQILFCMLIDQDKQPVGYRIFKGDTFEGHTFERALQDLKTEYQIEKVIVVADRGMLSSHNIELTQAQGYEFILGERLKNLPQKQQDELLDLSRYQKQWTYTDSDDEQIIIKYTTLELDGKKIIATYSQKRAKKDKHDRDQRLQTAQTLLKNPSLLKKKPARFFLKSEAKEKYVLDEEKVKNQEKYDGILAISTNNTSLSVTDILSQYKQLFKIEHTFRTFKSHLEMRPMFHWTDKRIEGHICLCYIAYTLLNYVLIKTKGLKEPFTENSLRKTLNKMQLSLIEQNQEQIYLSSATQPQQAYLLAALGIRPLPAFCKDTYLAKLSL
jgi:transposase